jgi:hypothetical protein
MKADENVVRRILQAGVGLVQLASRLRCQLTQLVPVRYMGKSPKNQIGSHFVSPSILPTVSNQRFSAVTSANRATLRPVVPSIRVSVSVCQFSVSLDARDSITGQHFYFLTRCDRLDLPVATRAK